MQWIALLKDYVDYAILGSLGVMAFIAVWLTIERLIYYWRINIHDFNDIYTLDRQLTQHLTTLSTIGANAPYVGLLGTVVGILITFYDIGEAGGQIVVGQIMIGLALALKATAVGILVAIPTIMAYNGLLRRVEVKKSEWLSQFSTPHGN